MRVLLTGATGFIGRYLLTVLIQAGHDVVPVVRRPAETDRLLPRPASIRADFNHTAIHQVEFGNTGPAEPLLGVVLAVGIDR